MRTYAGITRIYSGYKGQIYEARLYKHSNYGLPCVDITTEGKTARKGMIMGDEAFAEWCREMGLTEVPPCGTK